MDIIQIILTIAACLGGLFLLYVIVAAIAFIVAGRQAKKFLNEIDGPSRRFPRR